MTTQFLKMESLLDDSVNHKLELRIERGGKPLTVDLTVRSKLFLVNFASLSFVFVFVGFTYIYLFFILYYGGMDLELITNFMLGLLGIADASFGMT